MLDLEISVGPSGTGLDIVPLAEMKKHLRISSTNFDDQITAAINEAAGKLADPHIGELNRAIFPTVYVRYLEKFPTSKIIRLPRPPLISVLSIEYLSELGESPLPEVDTADYIVRTREGIAEIVLLPSVSWPATVAHPRAVAVRYQAGYTTFPEPLKRFIKVLAAHYFEFPEAAHMELRTTVNRAIEFGIADLRAALTVPVAHDGWED